MRTVELIEGVEVLGAVTGDQAEILSPEALEFCAELHREFNPRRLELLRQRKLRQEAIDRGEMPNFLPETRAVREGNWQVLPGPAKPARGDHRTRGPQDGHQCAEFRRELLYGRL